MGLLILASSLILAAAQPTDSQAQDAVSDLPPAAVRYTRVVTWVWVGFFAFNGSMSAALTLWAPLSWWTLYNGMISYALMGMLFGGEWVFRQRLRRSFA